jgi:Lrp/AsnC family leucine-responsive transcriptional regulator
VRDLDGFDRTILRMLQVDGKTPVNRLAETVSLSETPCWRRVKKLEEEGYILGYKAIIDRRKVGYDSLVFVLISVNSHTKEATRDFERRMLECREVIMIHNISGEYDFLLAVISSDLDGYSRFIEENLRSIPFIVDIKSMVSLRDIGGYIDVPIE